jgi:hypothetical protein
MTSVHLHVLVTRGKEVDTQLTSNLTVRDDGQVIMPDGTPVILTVKELTALAKLVFLTEVKIQLNVVTFQHEKGALWQAQATIFACLPFDIPFTLHNELWDRLQKISGAQVEDRYPSIHHRNQRLQLQVIDRNTIRCVLPVHLNIRDYDKSFPKNCATREGEEFIRRMLPVLQKIFHRPDLTYDNFSNY